MLKMVWKPLDLSATCPQNSNLTACSSFGFLYLNLLVQLFSKAPEEVEFKPEYYHENSGGNASEYIKKYETEKIKKESTHTEVYDFIVVGAGAAGCVVANRLTEIKDWKVLLLEAGPEEPEITQIPALSTALLGSNVDWKYRTQYDGRTCLAQGDKTCSWPRGKVMGGSSSISSVAYIRGNEADFDEWAELGNEGWSYHDVLPYFKKSENNLDIERKDHKYHGVGGPQSVARWHYVDEPSVMITEAFNQRGLPLVDFNGPTQLGTMQSQSMSKSSERASANSAFIRPIRNIRKNLKVRPDSEVTQILIDRNVKRAYGVKYVTNGRYRKAIARREVIVSAGAINSPKLLMLSGIGPRKQLQNLHIEVIKNLPVGENLHDHVTFNGVIIALPNSTATMVRQGDVIAELHKYKNEQHYTGPLSGNGPVNSIAFLKTNPNLIAPDIQIQVNSVAWREYIKEPAAYDSLTILPTAFYDGVILRTMLLRPKSRGVLLLNTTDPVFGSPLIHPNYLATREDVDTVLDGVRSLLSLEQTKSFKSRGAYFVREPLAACAHHPWGTDAYYECLLHSYTSATSHPVGTCRMGPEKDRGAVVDRKLRVHGVRGLRVVDAAVMPVITRGDTSAPTLMIGEKAADLIKEDWPHADIHS